MTPKFRSIIATAIAFGLSHPIIADKDSRRAEAEEFVRLTLPTDFMAEGMTNGLLNSMKRIITKDSDLQELRAQISPIFVRIAQDPALLEEIAQLYSADLNDSEMQSLLNFAKNSAGQKYIRELQKGVPFEKMGLTDPELKEVSDFNASEAAKRFSATTEKVPAIENTMLDQISQKYGAELRERIGPIVARSKSS